MSLFVPPKPAALPIKPTLIQRARLIARSSLSILQGTSYGQKGVGRTAIPALPGLPRRWVFQVRDPVCARAVLLDRDDVFPKAELGGWMLRPLTGDSIFTTNGETWRRQRRLVDPALEQARVKESFARMREAADAAIQGLEIAARRGPVAVDEAMTLFAADVIFRTIFSEPIDPDDAREAIAAFETFQGLAYTHGVIGLVGLPGWLMPGNWSRIRSGRRLRRLLKKPLDRRLAPMAAGEPDLPADILTSLAMSRDEETGTRFTAGELLDQICMLFLAGHETSASALAWTLYLLSEAPEIQDRAREEVRTVIGDAPIAFAHMKRLAMVRDVFRESLRLYPPVTTVVREAKRPEPLGNHQARPGDPIFVAPWLLHRLSSVWADADAFDPDRFETAEGREAVRLAYLPFSIGPRVCPGAAFALQEATLMLALILQRFRLSRPEGVPPPDPVAKLTLRSANGVTVRLDPI